MGGQQGSEFEVTVTGQSLEDAEHLTFSTPGITALPKLKDGLPVKNQFIVKIDKDCAPGVYDARVMARLGISSARAFSVSPLAEVAQTKPSTSVDSALDLALDSICNASVTDRSINHYRFTAKAGQHVAIECSARGIDSKLKPVVAVADSEGNDLIVQRRSGRIDFEVPSDATYIVKIHDLTFKGGPYYFYRLALREHPPEAPPTPLPSTMIVSSFSWPPAGSNANADDTESEPNNRLEESQEITLPCDISGTFFPAADVDSYTFAANKGETWWVEVASERIGCPTDPAVVVQQVLDPIDGEDASPNLKDIAELFDIDSPVKRSSNGYSYDGPPYNAGSTDVLGKFEIPADGRYRIRVSDLFGGTRNEPSNRYRMIVRKAQPDFALVGWAMHMGLRNGDRNALSKPIALRGGATIPFEVIVVRRDGFDGEIEIEMTGLPEGVTATGLKIGAKKSRGLLLVSADRNAPRGLSFGSIIGKASIENEPVQRSCQLAAHKWPVANAKTEIPDPRLIQQIPVSVGGIEQCGLHIAPKENKVFTATEGTKLTIPLNVQRYDLFSGKTMSMSVFGDGFERATKIDINIDSEKNEAVIDLARTKSPVGEHTIALYGGAVQKYTSDPQNPKAKRKDIVDIYVSDPIRVRITPKDKK